MIKKMLILGAVNPGAIENLYVTGFLNLDLDVEQFDIYDRYIKSINGSVFHKILNKASPGLFFREINNDLLKYVSGKHYDVILVFKGMEIFPETLEKLKKHSGILANFNGDHPYVFFFPGSGNKNILEGIKHYDLHFSYAKTIVERLKMESGKTAYHIPFGYNSHIELAPLSVGPDFENQFVFIGAYDQHRAADLDKLKSPLITIYGDEKWRSRNSGKPYIQKMYQNRSLFGSEYKAALQYSSGVINLLREQNLVEQSHNMRTFEVPGFGGLLISQRTTEQMEYFEEDKEAVFFDTLDELRDKLAYLSKNQTQIISIKKAALSRSVTAGYSYDHRSRQMLEHLEKL